MSHELKTPLTSVLAFTEILARGKDGVLTEGQVEHLGIIKRNGRRLDGLIEDLLDVSRIETGNFSLEMADFPIVELFDELTLSLASMFKVRSQDLVVVPPVGDELLYADQNRIYQVVSNLLSNASKYAPENSTITLKGAVENGRLRISVTDEGPGLTEEDQQKVFTLFYRAMNHPIQSVAGLGVGLAIAKAIVDLHKGWIAIESAPGIGSTFIVELTGVTPDPSEPYPVSHGVAAQAWLPGSRLDGLNPVQ